MTGNIILKPIAFVKNLRSDMSDDYWGTVLSEITLVDELPEESLNGIETFSHVEIIYHFNKAADSKIITTAAHPRENKAWPRVGIFAQRKKDRPNHIGSTIAKFVSKKGKTIIVSHLDADDGTPVLDIKPLVKEFLPQGEVIQPGWISELMKNYWK
jgi:tRNA (adenine37-N6)-methyltransferase